MCLPSWSIRRTWGDVICSLMRLRRSLIRLHLVRCWGRPKRVGPERHQNTIASFIRLVNIAQLGQEVKYHDAQTVFYDNILFPASPPTLQAQEGIVGGIDVEPDMGVVLLL